VIHDTSSDDCNDDDGDYEHCANYLSCIHLDFIEIKAMTYCGKSDASSLTMQNVPWHQEVCEYGDALCKRLEQRGVLSYRYNIATEHEHSCCILIAREDKFKCNGQWYTWIDYSQFHQLMRRYHESNGKDTFKSEQYMQITPEWALYKSNERGFDPVEQRWHRNKTTGVVVEIPYEASESGCG
jgi:tRNA wybutosine-synthesizing protein 1